MHVHSHLHVFLRFDMVRSQYIDNSVSKHWPACIDLPAAGVHSIRKKLQTIFWLRECILYTAGISGMRKPALMAAKHTKAQQQCQAEDP